MASVVVGATDDPAVSDERSRVALIQQELRLNKPRPSAWARSIPRNNVRTDS